MTKHLYLDVPYAERALARAFGAMWCPRARRWYCTTSQYRSRGFRRWRDKNRWKRITVYPDSSAKDIREAKMHGCLWDPATRSWYLEFTGEDALQAWHKARLTPPPIHELRVSFAEREAAKKHGAKWDTGRGTWVVCTRTPLSSWLQSRLKVS
jgi:Domain of unknown function (DUF5710)